MAFAGPAVQSGWCCSLVPAHGCRFSSCRGTPSTRTSIRGGRWTRRISL